MKNIQRNSGQDLPDGWAISTLGEFVAKRSKGIVPDKTPSEVFELYSVPSLETGAPEIIKGKAIGSNKQIVDERTVLLCKINPRINRTWVVSSHSAHQKIASTEWITFPPNGAFDPKYLAYYLKQDAVRDFLAANASGVGGSLMRVKPTTIKDYPFPIAPPEQQKRIVAEIEKQFSRLDEAVANLKRVKANLKRYRAAVLKAAVEGKLTEKWREEHPGVEPASKLLERILAERRKKWEEAELAKMKAKGKVPKDDKWKKKYKDPTAPGITDLPELPKEWVWVSWEAILAHEDGAFKRGPFGSALKKSIFVESGYKVYEQYCPINDDCSFARYFITEEKFKEMEGFSVRAQDFLISCSGVTLGRITQVPDEFEQGVINQALLRVRVNVGAIDYSYFIRFFRSPYFQKQIFDNSQGAAIPNVKGVKELKAIPIPLPPLEEQHVLAQLIDEKMSVVLEIEKQIDTNLERTERLRQSILMDAFSGKFVS